MFIKMYAAKTKTLSANSNSSSITKHYTYLTNKCEIFS